MTGQFKIIVCPKCKADDVYFHLVGNKTIYRCGKCRVVFVEQKDE